MSAYIHQLPPVVALSQEPMSVTVATNNVQPSRARMDIELSALGPEINQVWTLGFSGKFFQFTFKGNPNNSGQQLPIADPSVGVTKRYVNELGEALMRHEWISEQFEIVVDADINAFKIALISRFDQSMSIISVAPVSHFTVNVNNVASPFLKPNLSALLKVISRKGREIAKLTGSYTIEKATLGGFEGRSTFDLGALFDLAPHLPDAETLDPSVPFTKAIAFRAYAQYFLRFADKHGNPPVAESLFRTTPSVAIFGGRSAATTLDFRPNSAGIYLCQLEKKRIVTKHQPSWFYLFPTERLKNLVVVVKLWLDDGTALGDWRGDVHDLKANRLHYYRTGFDQLKLKELEQQFNLQGRVVGYEWLLMDTLTGVVKVAQKFKLEDCRHDSRYLIYANGLGGMDTLHVKNSFSEKSEAERALIRRTDDTATFDPRLGAIAATDATMQRMWTFSTGLITHQYADQLRQLLVGDVWLIDTKNNRFLKLVADSKSIETRPKNGYMVSLDFGFKAAWVDKNAV